MSVAEGAPWSATFVLVLLILGLAAVQTDSNGEFGIEIGPGLQLTAWNAFAITYLVLGMPAFSGCDRHELVRRVRASPLARAPLAVGTRSWRRSGMGGCDRGRCVRVDASSAGGGVDDDEESRARRIRVLISLLIIAFSFDLLHARHDINRRRAGTLGSAAARVFSRSRHVRPTTTRRPRPSARYDVV